MESEKPITLPLFPLNTVLFPGHFLPLNIFEERYKIMISECLSEKKPFGVVLIDQGEAQYGPLAEPHHIGTMAKIVQAQRNDEGQFLILTVGTERFRILDHFESPDGYMIGTVASLSGNEVHPEMLTNQMNETRALLSDYLEILYDPDEKVVGEVKSLLALEPEELSFQVASMLDIDSVEKQNLLEADNATSRLELEIKILQRELELKKQPTPTFKLPDGGEINLN